jgi:hypothetical protein
MRTRAASPSATRSTPRWESASGVIHKPHPAEPSSTGCGYSARAGQAEVSANQAEEVRNQARVPKDPAAVGVRHASRGNGPSPSYCPSPDPRSPLDTIAGRGLAVLEPALRRPVLPAPNRRSSRKSLQLNVDKLSDRFSQRLLIPSKPDSKAIGTSVSSWQFPGNLIVLPMTCEF